MKKEHKKSSMHDATHVGTVMDYSNTKAYRSVLMLKTAAGFPRFIFTPGNSSKIESIIHSQAFLIEGDGYWHIPGTSAKFSKIDGEMFNPNCCEQFHAVFLQLNSLVQL